MTAAVYCPWPRAFSGSDVLPGAAGGRGAEVGRGPLGSQETGLCRGEDSAVRSQLSPFAVTLDVRCLL